jgi:hypothetical protein
MKNPALKTLILSSIALAMPLAANADPASNAGLALAPAVTAASPIRLDAVKISEDMGFNNNFAYPGSVNVSFTNTSAVPAKEIVFNLRGYKGRLIGTYRDVGSFAQGQTVSHHFTDRNIDGNQLLEVDKATFADGTVWEAGQPNPMSRRQATQ